MSTRYDTSPIGTMTVSPENFKTSFRDHPAGVALVTADPGAHPVAMTVSSLASVSVAPPLLVFSASSLSSSTPALMRADTVVVHMLNSSQLELAKLGATSGVDRFADKSAWRRLQTGEPFFPDVNVWIRGCIVDRMAAGDSTVFLVQAIENKIEPSHDTDRPLVYHGRAWHALSEVSKI